MWLWGKGNKTNKPLNASGFAVGDKGVTGIGWGHISAASPTRVGRYLFLPVVTGTVYVIDLEAEGLTPKSIVALNDLRDPGRDLDACFGHVCRRSPLCSHDEGNHLY